MGTILLTIAVMLISIAVILLNRQINDLKKSVKRIHSDRYFDAKWINSLEDFIMHPPNHKIGDKYKDAIITGIHHTLPLGDYLDQMEYRYTATVIKSGVVIHFTEKIEK